MDFSNKATYEINTSIEETKKSINKLTRAKRQDDNDEINDLKKFTHFD